MADFYQAVEKILIAEGGYINDPLDKGGETKYGISKRSYPEIDIKSLTKEKAMDIYRRDFWQNYGGINSQDIAEAAFHIAVNCGCGIANRVLQQAANDCGAGLTVDGAFGAKTLAAINTAPESWLLAEIKLRWLAHYVAIVERNKSQIKYLLGWTKRALT
jgi:lysozyme family protein